MDDSKIKHGYPDTSKFDNVGVALISSEFTVDQIKNNYYKTGKIPHIHPMAIYEVKGRGLEGDVVVTARIALENELLLVAGTHHFYIDTGFIKRDPTTAEIRAAKQSLEKLGIIQYDSTAISGSGREVRNRIEASQGIVNLINQHILR